MTNKAIELYPIVEKTVTLTKDDYYRLLRANTINNSISDSLLDLLIKAHTKIEDRRAAMWDGLAQQYFGFESYWDAEKADKCIEISWANMQINLRSKA